MRSRCFAFIVLSLTIFSAQATGVSADVDSGSMQVKLLVPGCNENGICEASLGENRNSCALDCTTAPQVPAYSPAGTSVSAISHVRVEVSTTTNTVKISWQTETSSLSTVSWGLTTEYDIGTLSEVFYKKRHEVTLQNLKPNTLYFFKIEGRDLQNIFIGASGLTFRTYSLTHMFVPPAVSKFTARVVDGSVVLNWQNVFPQYLVRIMKSDRFYPLNAYEGRVLYEGFDDQAIDTNVIPGKIYYYTAFIEGENGVYSAGVLSAAYVPPTEPGVSLDGTARTSEPVVSKTISTSTLKTKPPFPVAVIPFTHLSFFQYDKEVAFSGFVSLDAQSPTAVVLPQKGVPAADIVVVSLTSVNPPYENLNFFMTTEQAQARYVANMGPLRVPGDYSITVVGLDESHKQLFRIEGLLKVFSVSSTEKKGFVETYIVDNWSLKILVILGIIVSIIVILIGAVKRRLREEE